MIKIGKYKIITTIIASFKENTTDLLKLKIIVAIKKGNTKYNKYKNSTLNLNFKISHPFIYNSETICLFFPHINILLINNQTSQSNYF